MDINWKWFRAALIRSARTICQTAASMIVVGQPVFNMDWKTIAAVSFTAGVASILTSLAGLPEVPEDGE